MRILLTGPTGQVGWELERTLLPLGQVVAVGRQSSAMPLDLADLESIRGVIQMVQPDLIVNAAAYTAVDRAETEADLAMQVNGMAPGVMAEEAKRLGIPLIHFSTDYVFDGNGATPYTEADIPNPINIYGHSKLTGELAIQQVGGSYLIFRTSWVYGQRGKNFLLTMLRLAREREELRIVADQIGAPTWSRAIAETTAQILAQGAQDMRGFCERHQGLYHLSASGQTSWYDFTRAVLSLDPAAEQQRVQRVVPITTAEYPTRAQRPAYSVLDNGKLFNTFHLHLGNWWKTLRLVVQ